MKKAFVLAGLVMLLLISACGDNSDKFLGTWNSNDPIGVSGTALSVTITKNGKNFIVSFLGLQYPAIYDPNNDELMMSTDKGTAPLIIDEKSHCLISDGVKYTKQPDKKASK